MNSVTWHFENWWRTDIQMTKLDTIAERPRDSASVMRYVYNAISNEKVAYCQDIKRFGPLHWNESEAISSFLFMSDANCKVEREIVLHSNCQCFRNNEKGCGYFQATFEQCMTWKAPIHERFYPFWKIVKKNFEKNSGFGFWNLLCLDYWDQDVQKCKWCFNPDFSFIQEEKNRECMQGAIAEKVQFWFRKLEP